MAETTGGSGASPGGGSTPPPERPACSICGKAAPETQTDYTPVSSQHGWRRSITTAADGSRVAKWICKECWEAQHQPS